MTKYKCIYNGGFDIYDTCNFHEEDGLCNNKKCRFYNNKKCSFYNKKCSFYNNDKCNHSGNCFTSPTKFQNFKHTINNLFKINIFK